MSVPVLVKLGIPLALGGLFLLSKKGNASEVDPKAEELTTGAVQAMQKGSAQLLETVSGEFRNDDADPTTADLLDYQKGRMIARGTPGFTDVPLFTDDAGLAIDNQEIVPRLIQLEGRSKALRAWAKAYGSVGAKMAQKDLNDKADALDKASGKKASAKSSGSKKTSASGSSSSKAKAKAKASTKGNAPTPDLTSVIQQVTDATATGNAAIMHKVAADLRAHGYTEQADALDAAADEIEAAQAAADAASQQNQEVPVTPSGEDSPIIITPAPAPAPVSRRTYTVVKGDSESAIAKKLTGNANLYKDLVAINVPTDADGRSRQKVTVALIGLKNLNPNRLGGLYPGLNPGQNLWLPDDWKMAPSASKPAPSPKPKATAKPRVSTPSQVAPDTGDDLTTQLITMLVGKSPGQEDTFMVKKWQSAQGRTSDGKYGPGDATYMADNLGVVPPSPLYWPKSNTQKALTAWHQEMSRLAVQNPDLADAYSFADQAGKQPGFEGVPLGRKIVSRRYGDGLGSL